ncbi:MAG TPA: hypothetical protein VGI85_00715 [Chthoniobacterales bacterium]
MEFPGFRITVSPSSKKRAHISRYETIIATLVGVSAVFVSGYAAYVQRQQVRAAVWPILQYDTSDEQMIRFSRHNKGFGPAVIRHVTIRVDGHPVRNWNEAFQRLVGPGKYKFSGSSMKGHVLSAGEGMDVLVPHNPDGTQLKIETAGPLWSRLNKDRYRVEVEICYCSTLGECWTLRSDSKTNSTTEASSCDADPATAFQQ